MSTFYVDNGEPVDGSECTSTTLHLNMGVSLSDQMEWHWVFRYEGSDSKAFLDDSGGLESEDAVLLGVGDRDIQELALCPMLAHTLK
ncbi:hypothetical protein NKDENANG_04057 [Candidatus Entotheonellaceae bacterium PAL068K]